MKQLAGVFLIAATSFAADFYTGQAARLVIGQRTFTAQIPDTSAEILGGVSGLAYANDTLIVADANRVGAEPQNHRVIVFKNISQLFPSPVDELPQGDRCPVCIRHASLVLGQPDFSKKEIALSQSGLRLPTGVATDGQRIVVADTDNNRVLIWNRISDQNGAPADVVVGQENFTSNGAPRPPSAKSLRGPQGVWIQDGMLFVADTQNHRVLIWRSIPSSNGQPADIVLGQPDFSAIPPEDLAQKPLDPKPETLLNPVSVTADPFGRLYVADLGHNRVLIWNSIPTRNQQPADIALGQPDLNSAVANYSTKLCTSNGKNDAGEDLYPARCAATLDFPRFALSDGKRLFVADGGNDRILVFNDVPVRSGQSADVILGQINGELNMASDNAEPLRVSAADALRAPMSLAWDGLNLYVSDPFNRRVLAFTASEIGLLPTAVRNAASRDVFSVGSVVLSGELKENDQVTIKIKDREYNYKQVKDDSFDNIINRLVEAINAGAGDPDVLASPNLELAAIILTARRAGPDGNDIEYSATTSTGATLVAATGGAKLTGGQDAAKIAPGTLVSILGENLSDETASAAPDADPLPTELGGVQVYFDGMRAPLLYVSPKQINAQVPFEVSDASSINAYVRIQRRDGTFVHTAAVAVPIIPSNPAIFAEEGVDPRPGVVLHGSSEASGTVSVDGSVQAGDVATVVIEDREYTYTVQEGDTLASIRDALIEKINEDPKVRAFAAGVFTRIRLRAREPGPAGNDIPYSATVNEGAQVLLTPTGSTLCCANVAYSRVTEDNPAIPGETIIVYATGLGLVKPLEALEFATTGVRYRGPEVNEPVEFVSSLAAGKTANVLFAGLKEGTVGMYEVHLELNSDIPTDPQTQLTIAQSIYVSNIITFPVFNPKPPEQ